MLPTKKMNHFITALLLGCFALLGSACSFVYDFEECSVDADCQQFAVSGQTLSCESNECVATQIVTEDTEPVADTSNDVEEDVITEVSCATNTECIEALGESFICLDEICFDVAQDGCTAPVYFGAERDKVVFVGSLLPTSPPYSSLAKPMFNSISLAFTDFNRETSLPGRRGVAWIHCDSRGDSAAAVAAAKQLVKAGVPGFVGPLLSSTTLDVVRGVTAEAGVLNFIPGATAASITNLDDNNLAWRVLPSDLYQGDAFVRHIEDLYNLTDENKIEKVWVFYKDDVYGQGLQSEMNGPLLDLLDANYRSSSVADLIATLLAGGNPTELNQAAIDDSITKMGVPDVVAMLGTTEMVNFTKLYIEKLEALGTPKVPLFLFSHGVTPVLSDLINKIGDEFLPATRTIGANIFDEENYAAYSNRYAAEFPNEILTTVSSLTYDSTLLILLALSALPPEQRPDGFALASVMPKLNDKASDVFISFLNPGFIQEARNALANGGTIDVKGVSGDLDFNDKGDVLGDFLALANVRDEFGALDLIEVSRYTLLNPENGDPDDNGHRGVWSNILWNLPVEAP